MFGAGEEFEPEASEEVVLEFKESIEEELFVSWAEAFAVWTEVWLSEELVILVEIVVFPEVTFVWFERAFTDDAE